MLKRRFPEILLLIKTYVLVLSIFSFFRFVLFLTQLDKINFQETSIITIFESFVMGIRFDTVISGYILIIPAFFLILFGFLKFKFNFIKMGFFYFIFILFTIAFFISVADIPYFNHFYSRFSVGAFEWIDNTNFVVKMVFQDFNNVIALILFFVLIVIFYIILKKIFNTKYERINSNIFLRIFLSIIFLLLIFVGIRGRIEKKSPIRIGTAYFCNNSFLNQLGLNPVFTLIRTYLDSIDDNNIEINLINDDLAIENVQKYLKIEKPLPNSIIARKIIPDSISKNKPNVVLVIMEGMSTAKMTRYGNNNNLTPFLDSLSYQSYYFDNIYTAGEHTFNGIFSTLFSFPALYRQHSMNDINIFNGINTTLAKHGYSSTYFMTHDSQFDNVEGFLKANSFDNVVSQKDYPSKEVKTTLGVPDDFMFEFSIPYINNLVLSEKPFFVSYMTTSDHPPHYIPEYFTPKNKKKKLQITEYADWSLNKFLKLCSKQKWYDNTLFIFIADHGVPLSAPYDISLDYHHTPLIFFAPKLLNEPQEFNKIGGQIDVFPTIMGMLNLPYVNNTLGIDLLKEDRPYIYINADDKIGVLDNQHLLILNSQQKDKLYLYKEGKLENCILDYEKKAKSMKEYAFSNMQVYQYLLSKKMTSINR